MFGFSALFTALEPVSLMAHESASGQTLTHILRIEMISMNHDCCQFKVLRAPGSYKTMEIKKKEKNKLYVNFQCPHVTDKETEA